MLVGYLFVGYVSAGSNRHWQLTHVIGMAMNQPVFHSRDLIEVSFMDHAVGHRLIIDQHIRHIDAQCQPCLVSLNGGLHVS